MTTAAPAAQPSRSPLSGGASLARMGLLLAALALLDAFALYMVYAFINDGVWELALTIVAITLMINVVNLRAGLYALRWIAPALALMCLLVVYPIIYTVYVSFTNYGDGNLLTKEQVLQLLAQETYLPEGGRAYLWTLFQNDNGDYALWLADEEQPDNAYFATLDSFAAIANASEDPPPQYEGYRQLSRGESLRAASAAEKLRFGNEDSPIGIASRKYAGEFAQRYTFQPDSDAVLDNASGLLYYADYSSENPGQFVNADGESLRTGFIASVGLKNFTSFLERDDIRIPLLRIFIWTISFSFLSVFTTFVVGMFFALLMQNPRIPLRKVFRTLLIVPWAIPGLISVAVWKGMLNPNLGVIASLLGSVGIEPPPVFIDPGWVKVAILLVNLWLGYPYFMLICSGALAAIPSDMYEAAEVDGAGKWHQFRDLTLPLLLVAVGPLLIASFTFNFNNFVLIEAFNAGGPPMVEAGTLPAGHTDILISYAFRLAFGGGRGADFGLASAITIVIFLMVAAITLLQFRLTKGWEETSENV